MWTKPFPDAWLEPDSLRHVGALLRTEVPLQRARIVARVAPLERTYTGLLCRQNWNKMKSCTAVLLLLLLGSLAFGQDKPSAEVTGAYQFFRLDGVNEPQSWGASVNVPAMKLHICWISQSEQ